MPDIGLDEVEIIEILVNVNDMVEIEQGLITVEGEKASMEIPSPISGMVKKIFIKIGDKVKTSSILMSLKINNINSYQTKKNENLSTIEEKPLKQDTFVNSHKLNKSVVVHATPFIRRLARNLNIELQNVVPTGRKNRILKEDVELYVNQLKQTNLKESNTINSAILNIIQKSEIELSSLQKIVGVRLEKNWKNIPHVTHFDEFDITILEQFRKKYNAENNVKNNVTILVFILKVVAYALKKYPIFNSSLSDNKKKIVLNKYINIGVAVDVKDGLFVPVLKDVDKKNIKQLSFELINLAEKARHNKLNSSDMTQGSFTISNLGGIGGTWFSPIINSPEIAILGVSKSKIKPLWNGKEFIPSLMLPLSLSYDHRVINGADAARFVTFIGKLLSDMHFLIM
ncbi:dihydrolipoamide acetyltransferase [Buchnera aphidicola (Diuraphis noxia)]|uniref:Dihydrolipoamide acetyltransferase component of pyruvate dehydrogenase complex n=2 Tax=Buchnera aphidicola TaxID=9 RepID=A0A1B2H992_BUCDN|nr:dihydrolipoamide acetyltransferase [Buchnera aphidicola (Diuraphis noxia)]